MNKILAGAVALMSTFIAPAFGHSGGLNSKVLLWFANCYRFIFHSWDNARNKSGA